MAPRGRGRGRGRSCNNTRAPETNPNDPVNFMTALENMAAAMQATAEALGQQMNNHGNDGGGVQGPMTLANFLKVNPPKFKGTTSPTEADTWFQAMEQALQAQVVPEGQRVEFATYLLTGEASHWWQGIRRLLQQGDDYITWDVFQEEFYKKYFPTSARTAKELELLQLKQGTMSVSEYTNKFEELFRFSRMCQGTPVEYEEWKCVKYEGGLRSDIFSSVGPMEIRTFSELVNKCRVAEECVKRVATEKGNHKGSFPQNRGKSFAPRGPSFKRGGSFRRPNNNNSQGKRFGKQPQNDQACTRCGSHHPGVPCKAGWGLCYNCGKAGHKAASCLEKQKQGAGKAQQTGRVFTTSAVGAEGSETLIRDAGREASR
ncbi:uncharacterized protein [Arachis hypogaea]|uniref:uncharacterized protein n=1 Tax=Arachis hypogaea TaxID=3818 RepID=UPI003B20D692